MYDPTRPVGRKLTPRTATVSQQQSPSSARATDGLQEALLAGLQVCGIWANVIISWSLPPSLSVNRWLWQGLNHHQQRIIWALSVFVSVSTSLVVRVRVRAFSVAV